MRVCCAFVVLLILSFSEFLLAVDRHVSSAAELRSALAVALPGDQIIVANGSYAGRFDLSRSGEAGKPIVLRAENRHRAVLIGAGMNADNDNVAHRITGAWWVIDGFEIRNYRVGVFCDTSVAPHIEVRHNLIHNFAADGIRLRSSYNHIHDNVVAFSPQPGAADIYGGIRLLYGASDNLVERNVVYAIGNGHQIDGSWGMGIYGAFGVHRNRIRGNLVMSCVKGNIRIYSDNNTTHACTGNVISDNIVAFGHGGGISLSSAYTSDSLVVNNIVYGNYYSSWGAKGNTPGRNVYSHNTSYLTEYSMKGSYLSTAYSRSSKDTVIKDNIFYSNVANNGSQWLWVVIDWLSSVATSANNLFWRPGATSTWTKNVSFSSTDIHSSSQQPLFTYEAAGDLSLREGSPGKRAASDGTDIGACFNQYLRKDWMARVTSLEQQKKSTNGSTAVSFATSSAHTYQVYAYIPTDYYNGTVTYTVEGQTVKRNLGALCTTSDTGSKWVDAAPQRWVWLGAFANDGVLNVKMSNAKGASSFSIRRLPSVEEAYAWINATQAPSPPSGLRVVSMY